MHRNDSSGLPHWSLDGTDCLGNTMCEIWKQLDQLDRQVDGHYWDFDPGAKIFPVFQWINMTEGPLSAAVKLPYVTYGPPDPDTGLVVPIEQRWWISVCSFVPHWVPGSISLPIRRTNVVETDAAYAEDSWDLTMFGDLQDSVMINVEQEWADMLNMPVNNTLAAFMEDSDWDAQDPPLTIGILDSLLGPSISIDMGDTDYMSTAFQHWNVSVLAVNIEKILSLVLVNGLSLATSQAADPYVVTQKTPNLLELLYTSVVSPTGYDLTRLERGNGSCAVISSSQEVDASCLSGYDNFDQILEEFAAHTSWTFTVDQFGYGAGIASPTLTFALSMVYAYLIVLFAYLLGLLVYCQVIPRLTRFGEPREPPMRVAAWEDLQDIVALSWKSRCPDELHNTGAGVDSFSKVWKRCAMVRVTSGSNLELVINDPGEMERARKGVYYS